METLFKGILVIILLFQFTVSNAQIISSSKPEKNVPVIVLEKFNQKFPSHDPVWFSQYRGRYDQRLVFEGKFIFDNRYSSAVYDKDGNMVAFAATIEKTELPDEVIKYMNVKFPSFSIVDVLLVTREKNDITYEIGIYIDNEYVIKVFSKNGDFVKSTKA